MRATIRRAQLVRLSSMQEGRHLSEDRSERAQADQLEQIDRTREARLAAVGAQRGERETKELASRIGTRLVGGPIGDVLASGHRAEKTAHQAKASRAQVGRTLADRDREGALESIERNGQGMQEVQRFAAELRRAARDSGDII